jgi:hypothetical protein
VGTELSPEARRRDANAVRLRTRFGAGAPGVQHLRQRAGYTSVFLTSQENCCQCNGAIAHLSRLQFGTQRSHMAMAIMGTELLPPLRLQHPYSGNEQGDAGDPPGGHRHLASPQPSIMVQEQGAQLLSQDQCADDDGLA